MTPLPAPPPRLLRLTSPEMDADEMAALQADLAQASHILVVQGDHDEVALRAFNHALQTTINAGQFPKTFILCAGPEDRIEWVTPDALVLARPAPAARAAVREIRDTFLDLLELNIPEVSRAVAHCLTLLNTLD